MVQDPRYNNNIIFNKDGLNELLQNIKKYPVIGVESSNVQNNDTIEITDFQRNSGFKVKTIDGQTNNEVYIDPTTPERNFQIPSIQDNGIIDVTYGDKEKIILDQTAKELYETLVTLNDIQNNCNEYYANILKYKKLLEEKQERLTRIVEATEGSFTTQISYNSNQTTNYNRADKNDRDKIVFKGNLVNFLIDATAADKNFDVLIIGSTVADGNGLHHTTDLWGLLTSLQNNAKTINIKNLTEDLNENNSQSSDDDQYKIYEETTVTITDNNLNLINDNNMTLLAHEGDRFEEFANINDDNIESISMSQIRNQLSNYNNQYHKLIAYLEDTQLVDEIKKLRNAVRSCYSDLNDYYNRERTSNPDLALPENINELKDIIDEKKDDYDNYVNDNLTPKQVYQIPADSIIFPFLQEFTNEKQYDNNDNPTYQYSGVQDYTELTDPEVYQNAETKKIPGTITINKNGTNKNVKVNGMEYDSQAQLSIKAKKIFLDAESSIQLGKQGVPNFSISIGGEIAAESLNVTSGITASSINISNITISSASGTPYTINADDNGIQLPTISSEITAPTVNATTISAPTINTTTVNAAIVNATNQLQVKGKNIKPILIYTRTGLANTYTTTGIPGWSSSNRQQTVTVYSESDPNNSLTSNLFEKSFDDINLNDYHLIVSPKSDDSGGLNSSWYIWRDYGIHLYSHDAHSITFMTDEIPDNYTNVRILLIPKQT